MWFVYIPSKVEALGLSDTGFSGALFMIAVSSLVSMQLCSRILIPRFGAGPMIPIGIACFSVAIYLFAAAASYEAFLAAAALLGLTVGLVTPPAIVETSHLEKVTGRIFVSTHLAFFSLGGLFGTLAGGLLISRGVEIQDVFAAAAVSGLAVAGLTYRFLTRGRPSARMTAPPLRIPDKGILGLGALAAINMGTVGVILDWSALWLTRDLMVSLALGGSIIFAFNVGEIASRLSGERLLRRLGERLVGGYAMMAGGTVLLVAVLSENPVLIIFAFAVFGFLTANFIPVLFRAAARIGGEESNLAVADLNFMTSAGLVFGPPIVGMMAQAFSLGACMVALALLWGLCGFGLAQQLGRSAPQPAG
jgi:MFS family permease